MTAFAKKIYGGRLPREIPAYSVVEAARYIGIHYTTLYSWLKPVALDTEIGVTCAPIIQRPDNSNKLTFLNLVEGHVAAALRLKHKVPLREIRTAIEYMERRHGIKRPLASPELMTAAGGVFLKEFSALVNVGRSGQLALKSMLEKRLERVEYDDHLAVSLYPLVHDRFTKSIQISPSIAFGKPVVSSSGVTTIAIFDRFNLGESQEEIAQDYGIKASEVEEAIIYEAAA